MTSGSRSSGRATAVGPLTVSAANPRYFVAAAADGTGQQAVYLTGSHIWSNLHDGMGPGQGCAETPERFDYDAYLDFLAEHGHNFIRLWRWEQFKSQAAGGDFHLCMTPQPWPRTGPGAATDGRPRFDLDRFDEAFFDRLRDRVVAAGQRGIYVAVMLFDGWALHLSPAPDHVEGHPCHAANNVNGVGIGSILDYQVLPLDQRVQQLQEAYIGKVVDTVGDLPNLLWEVANESSGGGEVDPAFAEALGLPATAEWGDSTAWQYWVIDRVRQYEEELGYDRHPIGMTMQFPVPTQTKVNDPLLDSRAEWISPGYDDEVFADGRHPMAPGSPQSRWFEDPPAADGRKVVISDTDHYAPGLGDALWAWKSFLRGHHPILMDFGIIGGVNPSDPSAGGPMSYAALEPARYAMGDTLRFASRMDLIKTQPRGELSSTGYALANPGEEYLVLQPSATADPFTMRLAPGTYTAEWFGIDSRQTMEAGQVTVDRDEPLTFTAPSAQPEPSVLYLRRTAPRPVGWDHGVMADTPVAESPGRHEHVMELRKEASTMALYVAICLLAGFAALPETGAHAHAMGIIWGVTIGLAAAHWFAFRVSARLVGAGSIRPNDMASAGAQLAGAAGVALLASVPVLLFPESVELELVELLLAAFIALVGFAVARGGGATRAWAGREDHHVSEADPTTGPELPERVMQVRAALPDAGRARFGQDLDEALARPGRRGDLGPLGHVVEGWWRGGVRSSARWRWVGGDRGVATPWLRARVGA